MGDSGMGLWEKRSLLCVTHLPTHRHRTHAGDGEVYVGLGDSGLGQGPQPRSQVGAGIRRTLLPVLASSCPPRSAPAPAWPVQPHKALFMPGEWPGGREPQRAAGGGEEEVAHEAREHLEAFEGGPAATALSSGVGH